MHQLHLYCGVDQISLKLCNTEDLFWDVLSVKLGILVSWLPQALENKFSFLNKEEARSNELV